MCTSLKILLVRKHQQQRILHFPVLNDTRKLRPGLFNAVAIVGVDDEYQALGSYHAAYQQKCPVQPGVHDSSREGVTAVFAQRKPTRNRIILP